MAAARVKTKSLDIPQECRVENRKPLTPEQQTRLSEVMIGAVSAKPARVDHRKPKGTSWDEWDQYLATQEKAAREKTMERIGKLKEKKPPKTPRAPGYKGHLAGSRKEQVHKYYDEKGVDAAIALAASLGLKDGTAFSWVKAWAKADGGPMPGKPAKAPKVLKKRK